MIRVLLAAVILVRVLLEAVVRVLLTTVVLVRVLLEAVVWVLLAAPPSTSSEHGWQGPALSLRMARAAL